MNQFDDRSKKLINIYLSIVNQDYHKHKDGGFSIVYHYDVYTEEAYLYFEHEGYVHSTDGINEFVNNVEEVNEQLREVLYKWIKDLYNMSKEDIRYVMYDKSFCKKCLKEAKEIMNEPN